MFTVCSHTKEAVLTAFLLVAMVTPAFGQDAYEWKFFTTLVHGRQQHEAVWIGTTKVLVIGGKIDGVGQMNGTPTTSCEVIDLPSASSVEVASMAIPRAEHTVLVDPRDSTVYVIGGVTTSAFSGSVTASIERYDPDQDSWTEVGQLGTARRQHVSYWLNEHEIMTVGGRQQPLNVISSAEIFDLRTGTSRFVADYPDPISSANVVVAGLYKGTVMGGRAGGPNSERSSYGYKYDAQRDRWAMALDVNKEITRPTIVGLWSSGAVIMGGAVGESPFDAIEHVWYADGVQADLIGFMQNGRQWHAAAQLNSDTIIVGGGYDDGVVPLNSCDWVDVSSGDVVPGPSMNVTRAYPIYVSVPQTFQNATPTSGTILAIGGHRIDGVLEDRVEILVRSCTGTQDVFASDMPKRLVGSATFEDGKILLTDTLTFSRGAAWIERRASVASGFSTQFTFRISNGNDHDLKDGGPEGADGIALVIQNEMPAGIGDAGMGIGYHDLPHGLAVEFDSYLNGAYSDAAGTHAAVQVGDGYKLSANHRAPYLKAMTWENMPALVADGSTYHAKIEYDVSMLRVWCDTTGEFKEPLIEVGIDVAKELGLGPDGRAWMGITSATGFSTERHEITGWTIGTCDPILVSVDDEPSRLIEPQLRIVPQPTHDVATLELHEAFGDAVVIVSSVSGQEMLRFNIANGQRSIQLPTQELHSGTYVVRVIDVDRSASVLWNVLH